MSFNAFIYIIWVYIYRIGVLTGTESRKDMCRPEKFMCSPGTTCYNPVSIPYEMNSCVCEIMSDSSCAFDDINEDVLKENYIFLNNSRLQVILIWEAAVNLDLGVYDPRGKFIWALNTEDSTSGARLEQSDGGADQSLYIEHISWIRPYPGEYTVTVAIYDPSIRTPIQASFKLIVSYNSKLYHIKSLINMRWKTQYKSQENIGMDFFRFSIDI